MDNQGWVAGLGGDPDEDANINTPNATRGVGCGPGDLRAILSQLDSLYRQIGNLLNGAAIPKAKVNKEGSTAPRPFQKRA